MDGAGLVLEITERDGVGSDPASLDAMKTLAARGPHDGLRVARRLLQDHVAQRHHETGLLRDADEHVGRHVDAVGLPAGQRLDTGDPAGRGADDGLVDEVEVTGGDRRPQRLHELEALQPGAADGAFVLHPLVLAA